eukprot:7703144-Pyramimonas_sp.AAC.1
MPLRPLGGFLGVSWEPLGRPLEPSGRLLGPFWKTGGPSIRAPPSGAPKMASWAPLGALLGALGA